MAVSRPLLLALIGVALIAAALTATRMVGERDSSPPQETASTPPAQKAHPARSGGERTGKRDNASSRDRKAGAHEARRGAGARDRAGRFPKQAAVARAIARRRVVVLFVFDRRGLDDRATAASVAAVRRLRGTKVFTDRVERVARYGPLLSQVGVSQAPSIVIVGRSRRARLVEGYVDPETLSQDVLDAR
jgi:hypothetical protein